MFIVGFLGCSYLNSFSTATRILTQETFTTLASYSLSVVPMFMLMGQFAFYAGIGARLYNFAYKAIDILEGSLLPHRWRALFGAVCGSVITTATIVQLLAG